jgi:hypothetical protein
MGPREWRVLDREGEGPFFGMEIRPESAVPAGTARKLLWNKGGDAVCRRGETNGRGAGRERRLSRIV